jgi:hypothetical protein
MIMLIAEQVLWSKRSLGGGSENLDLDDGAGWQLLQVGLHVICEAQSSLWLQ